LLAPEDIARSVDGAGGCLETVVNLDSLGRVFDSGGFEVEAVERGPATCGYEQEITVHSLPDGVDGDAVAGSFHGEGSLGDEMKALALEDAGDDLGGIGLLFGKEAFGEDGDLRAEALIGLRDFETYRASADDRHCCGELVIFEDLAVGRVGVEVILCCPSISGFAPSVSDDVMIDPKKYGE
jgi:hypothetical protein